ncbi:ABC transporter permease [Streptomyces prasinus]|uniref:ABC transporter permease n=1 Tax=Streptomyces prasinus TaxID=67345 RepID=UPI0036A6DFA7
MSSATASPPSLTTRTTRGAGPTGLTWTVLRIHRSALWLWIGYVAVTAALLLWLWGPGTAGLDIIRHCAPAEVTACTAKGPTASTYHALLDVTESLISVVPLLVAAFAGGALIGRELDSGTIRLAWTQSVSPARWLTAKLALPATLLVLGTITLVLLRRLVASSSGGLASSKWHTSTSIYHSLGPTAVVLPLLGLAIGTLVAFLVRRPLPALGLSLLVMGIVSAALCVGRDSLWPLETVTGSVSESYPSFSGVTVSEGAITGSGAHVPDPLCDGNQACLVDHDITGFYREGHPPTHFWPLQIVETGILAALTALLVTVTYAILKRKTSS